MELIDPVFFASRPIFISRLCDDYYRYDILTPL